jgi:hypothetical protein
VKQRLCRALHQDRKRPFGAPTERTASDWPESLEAAGVTGNDRAISGQSTIPYLSDVFILKTGTGASATAGLMAPRSKAVVSHASTLPRRWRRIPPHDAYISYGFVHNPSSCKPSPSR